MKGTLKMCGNHDAMAEASRAAFLDCDQELLISKFNLDCDEDYLYIRVLNTCWQVDRRDGFITLKGSSEKAPHDIKMAIYDLFCYHADSPDLPPLSGEWKSVADLGGILGAGHAKRLYTDEIIAPFAGSADRLKAACEQLGGTPVKGGDVSCLLPVFDFFPVWFQFWDADDEFPADIRFLWDSSSEQFIHYEILFYLTAYIESLLTEKIK